MKKKPSATGIFFSMFLRAVVVILGIVIACLIFALVRSLLHNKGKETASTGTGSSVVQEAQQDELLTAQATEAKTEAPKVDYGIKIAVLNGTQTSGLAGAWKEKLTGLGYTSVEAGNYMAEIKTSRIYMLKEGAGAELKDMLHGATVETEAIKKDDTDVDLSELDVILVIGQDDDILGAN